MNNWPTKKLSKCVEEGLIELKRGIVISEKDMREYPGPYPVYSSSSQNNGLFGTYGKYMFDEELITWSVDGGGYFFYRPKHKFSVTNVVGILRLLTDELIYKFVYYHLVWQRSRLEFDYVKKAHPSVIKDLYEIALPHLPIQQKIVKILDTIQDAVEIQEKIIEKTKEFKKSLMNLLFRYGIKALSIKELASSRIGELTSSEIEKLGLRLKKTEVGQIPEDWKVMRLGDEKIAEIKYGKGKPLESGEIPVIGSSGIYDWTNKALIEKPTIVIGRKGTVGIPHLSTFPCWPSDTAFYLDLNLEKIDPKFLYEYILFRPLSGEHAKTTLPSLKREDLENLKIPLPPLPEQQEIAEILQTIDQKIEIEKKKKELYEELFKSMLNKVMNQEIDIEKIEI